MAKQDQDKLKAIILCGGKGTRLKPLTNTTAKHLLPIANKPILFYVIEHIREAGLTDIGIVISPETGDWIKEAVGDGSKWDAHITYIIQSESLGLAHAVKSAIDFLGNSSFLMFLGDNVYQSGVKKLVDHFNSSTPDALILVKEVPDARAFGVAELDASGRVLRVVEKPKEPKSNLVLTGVYLFTAQVHKAIAELKPSWRGEYEITDAIQKLLDMGKTVESQVYRGWWFDTGSKDDLLKANQTFLNEFLKKEIEGTVDAQSQLAGNVQIQQGTEVTNSTIQGPVSIAGNCRINSSFIGPFVSIGAGTVIEHCSVENTIALENCHIQNIKQLTDSILGTNTEVLKEADTLKGISLFTGNDSKILL